MCNISCVQQIFESAELGKNTEIVAGFIVQVLWLAESARPMDLKNISDPAQSSGIHLKYLLAYTNF
jgi:hypothetical protein